MHTLLSVVEAVCLEKVLIIDDDADTPDILRMKLESYGFEVIQALSPADGIEKAREQKPDAVILDFLMPILNGLDVCKAIRQFSEAPILVLSVIDQPSIAAKILDAGADDYLVKPISDSVLQARLRRVHDRRRSSSSPPRQNPSVPANPTTTA
jgi:DNA-binding response OmpR family regulator